MNCEELQKNHPLTLPLLLQQLHAPMMATPLDTHLALIQLARENARWTAKEDSNWTSLVLFFNTKLPTASQAVPINALRRSLSKVATEITVATAILNNAAPQVHDA